MKNILNLLDIVAKLGENATVAEVAEFVYDNYAKVTGLPKAERDAEGYFPEQIEDLIEHYGFDMNEFSEAYGN